MEQINNFIKLSINNLYKFKPLQTEVRILPITVYDEKEQVTAYRENASYGLGKLEAVVATGIKQKHLTDVNRLEKELDLNTLLMPLQSSHTSTGDIEDTKTEKEEGTGDTTEEEVQQDNADE